MLDFRFINDELPMHSRQTSYAGSIEIEEFEKAQELKVIEMHLDYYGKFRWSSFQVKQKRELLIQAISAQIPNLSSILKEAFAGNYGLAAFGD
jgi:Tfp pilus assembly ATPase PilU